MKDAVKVYPLRELVAAARSRSGYYGRLYADLREGDIGIEELPLIDQRDFWAANSMRGNTLLTGPMEEGIVFKSGGTTGNPKFSVFTRQEWDSFTAAFGMGISRGIIRDGDRIANIFYAGELYASFLFIAKSLDLGPRGVLQFPVAGSTQPAEIREFMEEYRINVIAGVPTTILSFAEFVSRQGGGRPPVNKILYGGETMYEDQQDFLREIFPGVRISSIGYASVDAGLLGYADETCSGNEHRVFGEATVMEIIDESSGEVIREPGVPGALYITNLTRVLMPIIRYPAGDRGRWVEPEGTPDRKFEILGRSEVSARIGPMTLYVKDIREILARFRSRLHIINFQMVISHEDRRDLLTLRIAAAAPAEVRSPAAAEIIETVYAERPMFGELFRGGKVHPLAIEWVEEGALVTNPKTGKLNIIVDRRFRQ